MLIVQGEEVDECTTWWGKRHLTVVKHAKKKFEAAKSTKAVKTSTYEEGEPSWVQEQSGTLEERV